MKIERVKITPTMAEKWLDQRPPYQRKLIMRQVNKILLAINKGEWKENGATFVFDDKGFFIDGQQRAKAIALSGKPVWGIVVKNLSGGEAAFQTIDDNKARKVSDFLHTKQVHIVSSVARMYWMLENGIFPKPKGTSIAPPNADILKLIQPYTDNIAELVNPLIPAGKITGQLSFIVFLVFYHTEILAMNPKKISEFFDTVGSGLELKNNDPAYQLRHRFLNLPRGGELKRMHAQALILKALNLELEDRPCSNLKWDMGREEFPALKGYPKKVESKSKAILERRVSEFNDSAEV